MINHNTSFDHTENLFANTIKDLEIGKMLRKSNIKKACGISAYEIFQFLLLLVFQGKNLFRFLNSKHKDQAVSKNTYYRFLNETSYNWSRFLLLLAVKVTATFNTLTRPERPENVWGIIFHVLRRYSGHGFNQCTARPYGFVCGTHFNSFSGYHSLREKKSERMDVVPSCFYSGFIRKCQLGKLSNRNIIFNKDFHIIFICVIQCYFACHPCLL